LKIHLQNCCLWLFSVYSLIAQSNSNQTDAPDTSPQASDSNSTIAGITKIGGCKHIEAVCVSKAHTGKLII